MVAGGNRRPWLAVSRPPPSPSPPPRTMRPRANFAWMAMDRPPCLKLHVMTRMPWLVRALKSIAWRGGQRGGGVVDQDVYSKPNSFYFS